MAQTRHINMLEFKVLLVLATLGERGATNVDVKEKLKDGATSLFHFNKIFRRFEEKEFIDLLRTSSWGRNTWKITKKGKLFLEVNLEYLKELMAHYDESPRHFYDS